MNTDFETMANVKLIDRVNFSLVPRVAQSTGPMTSSHALPRYAELIGLSVMLLPKETS